MCNFNFQALKLAIHTCQTEPAQPSIKCVLTHIKPALQRQLSDNSIGAYVHSLFHHCYYSLYQLRATSAVELLRFQIPSCINNQTSNINEHILKTQRLASSQLSKKCETKWSQSAWVPVIVTRVFIYMSQFRASFNKRHFHKL